MPKRNYSSTAVATTLDGSGLAADVSATTCTVLSSTGFPSVPFTLVLSPDTLNEEIVTVTARSGNILTVSRNQESSGLHEHAGGAVAKHMITGRDLQEAQDHIYTTSGERSTGVHGLNASTDGVVVGSTQTVALTNKTISGSLNTFVDNTIPQAKIINLVTDLGNKAPSSSPTLSNATLTGTVTASAASSVLLPANTTIGNVNNTELSYLDGVSSAIQTQLNSKAVYPDQTGNSGKYLTTNGTNTSWATITAGGTGTVTSVTAGTGLAVGGVTGTAITTSGTITIDTNTTVDKTTAQTLTNKTLSTGSVIDTNVTGVTQSTSDNSTKIATTAFVKAALDAGVSVATGTGTKTTSATDVFVTNTISYSGFASAPFVMVTPSDAASANTPWKWYISSIGTTTATLNVAHTTNSNQTFNYNWIAIGV